MDLRKFLFSFQGRIGRADFWSLLLAVVALLITVAVASLVPAAIVRVPAMLALGALAFVVWLSATVRRLHDRDKSAWYLLLFFGVPSVLQSFTKAPKGEIIFSIFSGGLDSAFDLVCLAISIWMIVELGGLRGTAGPNRYGPIASESVA